jgi:radical SAM protein with 4Fe4S-binding SPASM domain
MDYGEGDSMNEELSEARTDSLEVRANWLVRKALELELVVRDTELLGSRRHFLRFDLYPLYAPSYQNRHYGFWDVPLKNISHKVSSLILTGSRLLLKKRFRNVRFKPGWQGSLEFRGYCILHISLWQREDPEPVQREIASLRFVVLSGQGELPLVQMFMPITQRCNLSCSMCMRHTASDFQESDISPEVLTALLDASPDLFSVSAMGIGEPLLNKNLCGIVGRLKRRMPSYGQVGLTTNGTLMTGDLAKELLDTGVNWICFSLDGATKETAERIRPGIDFTQLLSNIEYVSQYRQVSRRQRLWLVANFVMMEQNAQEMPAFVKLVASLGLDSVAFSHLRDFRTGLFKPLDETILGPMFQQLRELGNRYGVDVSLPRISPRQKPQCHFMEMAYVRLSGDVVPCCRMLEGATPGPVKIFGNLRHTPLMEIWNGAEYRQFRHRVLQGDLPQPCRGCDYCRGMVTL